MYKFILIFVIVSISACSGATSSGVKAKSPAPITAGPVEIQMTPADRGFIQQALNALSPSDREFVDLYTIRIVAGAKSVASLGTGTTIISEAHLYMGPARLGGVIVHEACHHWQQFVGKLTNGTSAESECNVMRYQAETRAV